MTTTIHDGEILMQPAVLETQSPMPGKSMSADPLLAGRASLRLEALGLMTAGIVHDLGNIIQILSGSVDVLDQHPTIKATTALQPAVNRAVTSLERGRALIKQILSFARDDAGDREDVDLAVSLAALERLLRWIGKHRMRVEIAVAKDTPAVFCNRWNLENAILNLALNARDAMADAGALSITATPCSSRGVLTGVALRVADNGHGMPPETLERAFDPFFTTKAARGNGLGLTMVRRFAQETGGHVTIESSVGLGTTVTLQVPVRQSPRP